MSIFSFNDGMISRCSDHSFEGKSKTFWCLILKVFYELFHLLQFLSPYGTYRPGSSIISYILGLLQLFWGSTFMQQNSQHSSRCSTERHSPLPTNALHTVSRAAVGSHPPLYFKPADRDRRPLEWTPLSVWPRAWASAHSKRTSSKRKAAPASWCKGNALDVVLLHKTSSSESLKSVLIKFFSFFSFTGELTCLPELYLVSLQQQIKFAFFIQSTNLD